MNELEPLCNFEQSKMLRKLDFIVGTCNYFIKDDLLEEATAHWDDIPTHNGYAYEVFSRPTISLAKNWLYEKYGVWMETCKSSNEPKYFESRVWKWGNPIYAKSENPHQAESDCLTEVLKKLTHEKSNS